MSDAHDHPTPEEAELAERGRRLIAAAVAEERAPHDLRQRLEADRVRAAHSWRGQLRVLLPAASGVAAMITVLVVIVVSGGARAPGVPAVALVSLRGHESPAPAQRADSPRLLAAEIDGVRFPYWGDAMRWEASGMRDDTIGGRRTLTVFYTGASGKEIGYSIVSGKALEIPDGRRVTMGGVTLTVLQDGERKIVTWRRAGHTCVISAPKSVPTRKLLELATWRGSGAVGF